MECKEEEGIKVRDNCDHCKILIGNKSLTLGGS